MSADMPELTADALPGAKADLREILRFADRHDPTPDFHARWGASYRDQVSDLWERHVDSYRRQEPACGPRDELLMVLVYHCACGGTGAPEARMLAFLHWLLDGIRWTFFLDPSAL